MLLLMETHWLKRATTDRQTVGRERDRREEFQRMLLASVDQMM